MELRNTSRYPATEVRRLVDFAMQGVETARVAVNVRNCNTAALAGRAYAGVPQCSPWHGAGLVDYLVTLRVGAPDLFPCDNLITRARWVRLKPGEPFDARNTRRRMRRGPASCERWLERRILEQHPYGGKRAPLIQMRDWREGLVVLAAHEGRHLWQFQANQPRSEVDCERFAAEILVEWRSLERES